MKTSQSRSDLHRARERVWIAPGRGIHTHPRNKTSVLSEHSWQDSGHSFSFSTVRHKRDSGKWLLCVKHFLLAFGRVQLRQNVQKAKEPKMLRQRFSRFLPSGWQRSLYTIQVGRRGPGPWARLLFREGQLYGDCAKHFSILGGASGKPLA